VRQEHTIEVGVAAEEARSLAQEAGNATAGWEPRSGRPLAWDFGTIQGAPGPGAALAQIEPLGDHSRVRLELQWSGMAGGRLDEQYELFHRQLGDLIRAGTGVSDPAISPDTS